MTKESSDLIRINDCRSVRISLAGPEDVLRWSSGEVTKAETINYRSHRPEKDGLFCERIFGPERDWECRCGKYRGTKFKGFTCDQCGVQVTHSRVRRKRMGHIELAAPVVHIWYFKNKPSILARLLGLRATDLEGLIYYRNHLVLRAGLAAAVAEGDVLSDDEARSLLTSQDEQLQLATGADAVLALLEQLDPVALAAQLRQQLRDLSERKRPPQERIRKLVRRLEVVEALARSGNRPAWMVLRRVPVIPPDLRPVVLLDNGSYVSSDLNDLYRRVLQRNARLKRLLELGAPDVILRNERRLLQQAVDALFNNTASANPVLGTSKRPLKSLTDILKGKEGRFRDNLLGKRVDYSGRSVIVVGPELGLHQCGLPKVMALELYQPFIIRELREQDANLTIQKARRMLKARHPAVWDALEVAMKGRPVLLNRAPTLHRMGIQSFEPQLVEGNAIRLHPLVCKSFNADFDGDQMAVHLPLSGEAIAEAKERLAPRHNILGPANGQPMITPSKDMVLGCYYLTARVGNAPELATLLVERRVYASAQEVMHAHAEGRLGIHDAIAVRMGGREVVGEGQPDPRHRVPTTVGRVLFNDVLPAGMPYYDLPLTAGNLSRIIADCRSRLGVAATAELLQRVMRVGFREATRSGVSFAVSDLCQPAEKQAILAEAQRQADLLMERFQDGLLNIEDRYEQVTTLWEGTAAQVGQGLMKALANDSRGDQRINPLHAMAASGARGSQSQINQLAGMRGLMRRPSGEVLEAPIKASFREGLSSLEYFSSTTGARKGLVDMAMKTSDSGYLTRKLVDVAQHVVVTEEDCGTEEGMRKSASRDRDGGRLLQTLAAAISGRVSVATIRHPVTNAVLVEAGQVISACVAGELETLEVEAVLVRSPLLCQAGRGVCRKCFGVDLARGALVEMGTAVGIIAAQSIGEPATQLTMRTFHTGGAVGAGEAADITLSLPRVVELFEARVPKVAAVLAEVSGQVRLGTAREMVRGRRLVFVQPLDAEGKPAGKEVAHMVRSGRRVVREDGELVTAGAELTIGKRDPNEVFRIQGPAAVGAYLLEDIQKVYRTNGIEVDDKHMEVILSRMLGKVRVEDGGDTLFLPGAVVDRASVAAEERRLGECGKKPRVQALLLGVTQAAVRADSFLSAASFQETTKVLAEAALAGRVDELQGLKENVLLGRLIPAGAGFQKV